MALKLSLKPNERMIIGGAVVTNGGKSGCILVVENKTPIMRQKDIMSENEADSPCRRIYFVIQLMYIDPENQLQHQDSYWKFVRELIDAAPSLTVYVDQINQHILDGKYYLALKLAGKLIDYEQEVIRSVRESS
jgi:flagellar protein FlbT